MIFLPRAYRSHMSDPLTLRPKNTIRFSRPPDLTACHTRGISHPAKKFPRAQRSRGESSARLSVVLAVLHPAGERYGPKGWGQDMCSPSYKQTGGQIKRGSPLPPHAGSHLTCLQFFSVTKYAYAEKQGGPHTLLQEDEQAGRERKPHTLENTDLLSHDAFLGHILPNWYHKDVYCCCRFKRGGGKPNSTGSSFWTAAHVSSFVPRLYLHRFFIVGADFCVNIHSPSKCFARLYPKMTHKIAFLPNWSRSFQ